MAGPQRVIQRYFKIAVLSDRATNDVLKFPDQLSDINDSWLEFLPPRKGEQLRGQAGAAIGGALCGLGQSFDRVIGSRRVLDALEIADNRGEQIVEVVSNAPGELADSLHFLTLMQLFFHQPA